MKLVYSAIASLDGYIEDEQGGFGWAAPDEEVHAFVNELERPVGTYLYGRRMYETMAAWETMEPESPVSHEFAEIWRAADKVVYSRSLAEPSTLRTRVERELDPAAVRRLKEQSEKDISVGGAELAGQAIAAGLVDEIHLFLVPVAVGAGKPALQVGEPLRLELLEERRFKGGTLYLRYAL
jgi:dihydrofolate reductase